ncbi:MAG: GTPase Era [Candidatus Eisenbacteria bacterium]
MIREREPTRGPGKTGETGLPNSKKKAPGARSGKSGQRMRPAKSGRPAKSDKRASGATRAGGESSGGRTSGGKSSGGRGPGGKASGGKASGGKAPGSRPRVRAEKPSTTRKAEAPAEKPGATRRSVADASKGAARKSKRLGAADGRRESGKGPERSGPGRTGRAGRPSAGAGAPASKPHGAAKKAVEPATAVTVPDEPTLKFAPPDGPFRCGYVALVGPPNVGKSTLMNRFLQQRLAIVTPKPQTTRRRTLGILSGPGFQIVLLDTPGLMDASYRLHRAMIREAEDALRDADVIVYLADASAPPKMIDAVAGARAPKILALNKVDKLRRKDEMLPVLSGFGDLGIFAEMIPISALQGDGVHELLAMLYARMPEGPPFYPLDQVAEQSERFFVAEIVRERIFEAYQEEVPYSTEVEINEFKERPSAKDFIEATIFVESESQKKILIGKGGQAIRQLGEDARMAIEEFLEREVFLSLRVRVLPKWRTKETALRRFGYRA